MRSTVSQSSGPVREAELNTSSFFMEMVDSPILLNYVFYPHQHLARV